jgi:hypothetical protein
MSGTPWIHKCIEDLQGALGAPWVEIGTDIGGDDADSLIEEKSIASLSIDPNGGVHRPGVGEARTRRRSYMCEVTGAAKEGSPDPEIRLSDGEVEIETLISRRAIAEFKEREGEINFMEKIGTILVVARGYFSLNQKTGRLILVVVRFRLTASSRCPADREAVQAMKLPLVRKEAARIRREIEMFRESIGMHYEEKDPGLVELLKKGEEAYSECSSGLEERERGEMFSSEGKAEGEGMESVKGVEELQESKEKENMEKQVEMKGGVKNEGEVEDGMGEEGGEVGESEQIRAKKEREESEDISYIPLYDATEMDDTEAIGAQEEENGAEIGSSIEDDQEEVDTLLGMLGMAEEVKKREEGPPKKVIRLSQFPFFSRKQRGK